MLDYAYYADAYYINIYIYICIYDIIWITIILHMSQAAESSIHRDEYTHYKESTYGMTIPYIINYHVLAIADVASISGLFRKAFVSVLVSSCIPEKISYSLLQSYGILWVSLEMGYTVYPQNCYLYRLAYWYTPKLLFLLGKSGEDDGSPVDLGKTKRCIVCMKNHRSQIETSKDQGYGSPLLWAGKSRKAVWDNISDFVLWKHGKFWLENT
jgi:hypothetical protein